MTRRLSSFSRFARLRGAQRIIKDRERRAFSMRDFLDLGGLTLADKGSRVRRI